MNKPKIIKAYEKLDEQTIQMVKLVYPRGYNRHLIPFVNKDGERKMGLPFETEDYYYLIRMTSQKAKQIVRNDDDYLNGVLKKGVQDKYTEKYDDDDFLGDYNANDDNDFDDSDSITNFDEVPDLDSLEDDDF